MMYIFKTSGHPQNLEGRIPELGCLESVPPQILQLRWNPRTAMTR